MGGKSSSGSMRARFVNTARPVIDRLTEADALAGDVKKILSSRPPPAIPRPPRYPTGLGKKK